MTLLATRFPRLCRVFVVTWLVVVATAACSSGPAPAAKEPAASAAADATPAVDDWAVPDGFTLAEDAGGFTLPTSVAFVPEPGSNPKDPRYFVGELRGTIKVVTNDGTATTFAQGFTSMPSSQGLTPGADEYGLAGLCLAPDRGYVFATFAAPDPGGDRHNHIVRFETRPGTFSVSPARQEDISGPLADVAIRSVFQIGACQVQNDQLYVGVGDGGYPELSSHLNVLVGKVLRLDLDGKPVAANPFYDANQPERSAGYVWASGFRNPFGLALADGRPFVADNGIEIDRFLPVEAGQDYLWNGSDWSIGANAAAVFSPSPGVTNVAYADPAQPVLPEAFRDGFFVGAMGAYGSAATEKITGVFYVPYDHDQGRVPAAPEYVVSYRGAGTQGVVAVTVGPDGLYFAPLFPNARGTSAVLKVSYNPQHAEKSEPAAGVNALQLMATKGCLGCHRLDDTPGGMGPSLGRDQLVPRLQARLASDAYRRQIDELDRPGKDPDPQLREARQEVMAAQGLDRVRLWIVQHLLEPRFDNPGAAMPNMNLTRAEAAAIAGYLMSSNRFEQRVQVYRLLEKVVPVLRYRDLVMFFVVGALLGVSLTVAGLWACRRIIRRRHRARVGE